MAAAFMMGAVASSHADDTAKLKDAMKSLQDQTATLGAASLDGENLNVQAEQLRAEFETYIAAIRQA